MVAKVVPNGGVHIHIEVVRWLGLGMGFFAGMVMVIL